MLRSRRRAVRARNAFRRGARFAFLCGLRLGWDADLQRRDLDRLGNVLELDRAEIDDRQIEPPLHMPIGIFGNTDGAGLAARTKDVIDRLNRGEAVDPSSYYFRTTPYFETSSENYSWLNRICSIATGSRDGDRRGFDVYQVL